MRLLFSEVRTNSSVEATQLKHFFISSAWTENVFVVGSVPQLGNWSPDKAIALSSATYPTWSGECSNRDLSSFLTGPGHKATVQLQTSTNIQYKYIKKRGSDVIWASDPNWRWETPASGNTTLNDSWR